MLKSKVLLFWEEGLEGGERKRSKGLDGEVGVVSFKWFRGDYTVD